MYTLHKQLSSNTDVTMLVSACEPVIRSQCATTEAMARNAKLNLTSSDVTHVMLTILCVSSVVHILVQRICHR